MMSLGRRLELRRRVPAARHHAKYGVTWSTINKALTSAWPQPRTTTASARPSKLHPFTPLIDEILLIDLDATRKQRHTITPDLPPSDRRALLVRGVALTT
ncbi:MULTISPECIES: hypothetical protein [unclassified Streptomyces]|uniref:hypothetical protein n=1 Tax=unclassified Streptomyces TaxID=2593676 RepID=UPI003817B511